MSVLAEFETVSIRSGPDEPSNPFLLTVSRKPLSDVERPIPVGVVSHRYSLIQHRDVAMRCHEGLVQAGVELAKLRYEVGVRLWRQTSASHSASRRVQLSAISVSARF